MNLDYIVGPGDIIEITVAGEKEFSGLFTVRSDNTIFYTYLKNFIVGGRSVREINDDIFAVLDRDFIKNPTLRISIKEYASKGIQITGAVRKPGAYNLKGPITLLEAVSLAGGLNASLAGDTVFIVRRSTKIKTDSSLSKTKEPETSNIDSPSPEEKTGSASKDHETDEAETTQKNHLESGTKVTKPEVTVEADYLISSVAGSETIKINYQDIVTGRNMSKNILVQPGDLINVPERTEVYVKGEVKNPGAIKFEDGMTLLQAIAKAGDTTDLASEKRTYILRRLQDGKNKKIKTRLDKIAQQKKDDILLQPNDYIIVPESLF